MEELKIKQQYDVIIIGGGITGAGTARDCAMRGFSVLLLERFDYTTGATSRNHGLLHSGARYAVNDLESATECISENKILKKIARHCVEETDGLFISLPEDDPAYQKTFVESCKKAGIDAEVIDPRQALQIEPSVNPSLRGAVRVPDGSVDPFRLTMANLWDARDLGATTLTYHEVLGYIFKGDRMEGVHVLNHRTHEVCDFYGKMIINASGIWGHHVASLAGININMFPAKGALLIFGHRVNNVVLNRLRKPANADILVPGDTICIIGTTSDRVPYDQIDNMQVTPQEVELLLREGEKLAPSLATTRILRAYAGVRPLVAADNDPSGRNISRGIVLLDHEERDGMKGFATITGGKLMTYRLMAEKATDLVCAKLGVKKECLTAEVALPGSRKRIRNYLKKHFVDLPVSALKASLERHGELASLIPKETHQDNGLVCECESVTVGEVNFAMSQMDADNLVALRRRVRIGMGTCQGELCAYRAAGLLGIQHHSSQKAKEDLVDFLNERWKGMSPIAWGECLRESQYSAWVYSNVCGLDLLKKQEQETIDKQNDEV